jgi:hypothetical protein
MSDFDKLFKLDMSFENRNARISRKVSKIRSDLIKDGKKCYGTDVIKKPKENALPKT